MKPHDPQLAGFAFVLAATVLAAATARGQTRTIAPERLKERLCWLDDTRLADDAALESAKRYLQRAKTAGYTGAVMSNQKWLAMPGAWGPDYQRRLRAVGEEARRLHVELIPMVMNFGDGGAILALEPELAEGMPVRDALFVVHGREARVQSDPPIEIANAGFETDRAGEYRGWEAEMGKAGVSIFVDPEVHHGGKQSVRMQSFRSGEPQGRCRLVQSIRLAPFRQYRMKVWVKTERLRPAEQAGVSFWTGRRHLCYQPLGVRETQDWTEHQLVFNSQSFDRILLRVGIESGGESGRIWFDDLAIEEEGLLNVLRRPGCPLTVRGKDGTEYEERRDFEPVCDPKLGRLYPWGGFSFQHDPPPLRLTSSSRIRDGERLRLRFFHATAVYNGQVSLCLSYPRTYERFAEGIKQIEALLHPAGYHISCGEIRTANWDDGCQSRHLTPAQLLADSIRRRIEIVRKVNPPAKLYAWSDMFDPWHNAQDDYYLCNGSWVGTWYGLPRDVIVMQWNYTAHEGKSPRFFAAQGFRQIILGDGPGVAQWLRANPDVRNIVGVFNFIAPSLEGFAEATWAQAGR
jgi:hypothetical protein